MYDASAHNQRVLMGLRAKYGVDNMSQLPEVHDRTRPKVSQAAIDMLRSYSDLRVPDATVSILVAALSALGVQTEVNYLIGDTIYDIYLPQYRTVICSDTAVNNLWSTISAEFERPYNDGIEKSKLAEFVGLRCIHWYDWDNPLKLLLLFQPRTRLNARDCVVKLILQDEAFRFYDCYHLQGSSRFQRVNFGLFYHDQLVAAMSFGKSRYNHNYQWELIRFCSDPEYQIRGGLSKLFKYFVTHYDPESIISYCDVAKFTGSIYSTLGMLPLNDPENTLVWAKGTKKLAVSDLLRRGGYDKMFHTHHEDDVTDTELLIMNGWIPMRVCGTVSYGWRRAN